MPTHLLCMREDLNLLLTRAPWRIPMMLPQAAQTTLTRLMSQATRTIPIVLDAPAQTLTVEEGFNPLNHCCGYVTQRTSHPAYPPDPGTAEPAKHPHSIASCCCCHCSPTTDHYKTTESHHPNPMLWSTR